MHYDVLSIVVAPVQLMAPNFGDGAGIMTDIPFELLGYDPDTVAVATLFLSKK